MSGIWTAGEDWEDDDTEPWDKMAEDDYEEDEIISWEEDDDLEL